jgi:hypothetical protein
MIYNQRNMKKKKFLNKRLALAPILALAIPAFAVRPKKVLRYFVLWQAAATTIQRYDEYIKENRISLGGTAEYLPDTNGVSATPGDTETVLFSAPPR